MTEVLYNPNDALGIYDVIIIGAGPCGLAVAARLREKTPSAMFTDEEQRRYCWVKKHEGKMSIKNKKTQATKVASQSEVKRHGYSMLVVDNSGDQWMSKWDRLFRMFEISHLRSPMFFHVDPRNRDGLLGYAHEHQRAKELIEIGGCVGQERSKHQRKKDRGLAGNWKETAIDERDRSDYYTPSTALFHDHCHEVVDKYSLQEGLLSNETLLDLDYGYVEEVSAVDKIFTVTTDKGKRYARTVVMSVGAGNVPCIPGTGGCKVIDGGCHAMHIQQFPDPHVSTKIRERKSTEVMIVGGGLTAAHLAANALAKGVTKVHMVIRSHLKVKPFDIDLSWMGKFRNVQQATFWSSDTDGERWDQIQMARNGGSITPRIHKVLKKFCDQGRLAIHTNTIIQSRAFDTNSRQWDIETRPRVELPRIDYIYFATGIPTDFTKLSYFQKMMEKYPIDGIGGLPCLSDDMAWCEEVPLYMVGKLASLRIGPGSANLAGARIGAERVAWSIQEQLGGGEAKADEASDSYSLGIGNAFESLTTGSETDLSDDTSDSSCSSCSSANKSSCR
ncbi:Cellobiose dehydrogenase [Sphaceloma murrayae]|uniref:Cellobiose dehydrogenase n=1 Tax=Sphaceloma murrayae TaxID=2082308 RepID=A0A2K1QY43_9PEZI|nr:Cellobiose dehydrogenase [Sphaceloma murrayae]